MTWRSTKLFFHILWAALFLRPGHSLWRNRVSGTAKWVCKCGKGGDVPLKYSSEIPMILFIRVIVTVIILWGIVSILQIYNPVGVCEYSLSVTSISNDVDKTDVHHLTVHIHERKWQCKDNRSQESMIFIKKKFWE